jgi:RimJ/RimL family protein N-acetyltransferase
VHAPSEDAVRRKIEDTDCEQRIILDRDTPVGLWTLHLHDEWLAEFVRVIAIAPGRGIGTYAVRRMIARAFDDLGAHRAYLEVVAENPARRLYEREGFILEGTFREGYCEAPGVYRDLCAYGMLAADRTQNGYNSTPSSRRLYTKKTVSRR